MLLGALAVLLGLFGAAQPPGEVSSAFLLATGSDFVQLPPLSLPTVASGIAAGIVLLAITAVATVFAIRGSRRPRGLAVGYVLVAVVALLIWAVADKELSIPALLAGSLAFAVPLVYGSLAGVLSERSGVVNIAIEGQLLSGAFCAAVIGTLTGNLFVALIAAGIAGAAVSIVLAVFAVRYLVDQVIVGVVLNVFVIGLTTFLHSNVLTPATNSPPRFERIAIPGLSQIPLVGPMLFNQTVVVYLMYLVLAIVTIALFRTRWGLRVRAVGEHPQAADTVGINVARTRLLSVLLGGVVAGLGGAYFTIGSVGAFSPEMTAGNGFIALAALIFGRWHPLYAAAAALLFGFTRNLQSLLGIIGSPIPSQFLLMLPYVVTIIAVAGFAGRVRGPAADGVPYVKS
ncbi:ABC transporter permease [Protaetiibacter larvae]|uniref:ABC transporter permease n=2 Tax=Protaetiibacter larvae TaxID=2592654 RepID=A0A5C1Y9W7_9MICO|nr:ABC transporter permease [Protaetiibacter larvae]